MRHGPDSIRRRMAVSARRQACQQPYACYKESSAGYVFSTWIAPWSPMAIGTVHALIKVSGEDTSFTVRD